MISSLSQSFHSAFLWLWDSLLSSSTSTTSSSTTTTTADGDDINDDGSSSQTLLVVPTTSSPIHPVTIPMTTTSLGSGSTTTNDDRNHYDGIISKSSILDADSTTAKSTTVLAAGTATTTTTSMNITRITTTGMMVGSSSFYWLRVVSILALVLILLLLVLWCYCLPRQKGQQSRQRQQGQKQYRKGRRPTGGGGQQQQSRGRTFSHHLQVMQQLRQQSSSLLSFSMRSTNSDIASWSSNGSTTAAAGTTRRTTRQQKHQHQQGGQSDKLTIAICASSGSRGSSTNIDLATTPQSSSSPSFIGQQFFCWGNSNVIDASGHTRRRTRTLSSSSPHYPQHCQRRRSGNLFHDVDDDMMDDDDIVLMMTSGGAGYFNNNNNQQQRTSSFFDRRCNRYRYYGPNIETITYHTMIPPPSWEQQASRSLLPQQEPVWKLQRMLSLALPTRNNNNDHNIVSSSSSGMDPVTSKQTPSPPHHGTLSIHPVVPNDTLLTNNSEIGTHPTTHNRRLTMSASNRNKSNNIHLDRARLCSPVGNIGVHCPSPAEAGILEIYASNNINNHHHPSSSSGSSFSKQQPPPTSEWMEHSFESASQAAQFQMDLLAMQFFGSSVSHMYQILELIHRGSIAYIGREVVIHDDREDDEDDDDDDDVGTDDDTKRSTTTTTTIGAPAAVVPSGIAWDDVMRCLGTHFPTIAYRLDALWWSSRGWATTTSSSSTTTSTRKSNYHRRRRKREEEDQQQHQQQGSAAKDQAKSKTEGGKKEQDDNTTINKTSSKTQRKRKRKRSSLTTAYDFLAPEYEDRRLLLGPIDFYRLFVPVLAEDTIPVRANTQQRMERLLRWRKRVARASVLVVKYARAKTIANRGWTYRPPPLPAITHNKNDDTTTTTSSSNEKKKPCNVGGGIPDGYIRRRLAYDNLTDNNIRDASAENEYYEGSVSRDAMCRVRRSLPQQSNDDDNNHNGGGGQQGQKWWWPWSSSTFGWGRDDENLTLSLYQGYTLVGIHVFDLPPSDDDDVVNKRHLHDPVLAIPSLKALIEDNHDVDFFVSSVFSEAQRLFAVYVFVRSLPKGIDPAFDNVVDRFINGDQEVRDRKLKVIMQLSLDSVVLSFVARCFLALLALILRMALGSHSLRCSSVSDWSSYPAMDLSDCGTTHHFGGSLRTDPMSPTNYVSHTIHLDSRQRMPFVARILLCYMEVERLSKDVLHGTILLAGDREDELPERVLGTWRLVRSAITKSALPPPPSPPDGVGDSISTVTRRHSSDTTGEGSARQQSGEKEGSLAQRFLRILVIDPVVVMFNSWMTTTEQPDVRVSEQEQPLDTSAVCPAVAPESVVAVQSSERASIVSTADPLENAVNEIVDILGGVVIPAHDGQRTSSSPLVSTQVRGLWPSLTKSSGGSGISTALVRSSSSSVHRVPLLDSVSRNDIRRFFVASRCSMETAALRIIRSAVWRSATFPIDTRICRPELQSGQFFQQGNDLEGNPVFYFRNVCLGPWRRDESGTIASVLHRLEVNLKRLARDDPEVKCCLIILLDRPYDDERDRREKDKKMKNRRRRLLGRQQQQEQATTTTAGSSEGVVDKQESNQGSVVADDDDDAPVHDVPAEGRQVVPRSKRAMIMNNHRIDPEERWHKHSNRRTIQRLIQLILTHYPERLKHTLIVTGNKSVIGSRIARVLALKSMVTSPRTRRKIKFLGRYEELERYVDRTELVTIVGGLSPIDPKTFEG